MKGARQTWVNIPALPPTSLSSEISYFTSLSLSFFLGEMEVNDSYFLELYVAHSKFIVNGSSLIYISSCLSDKGVRSQELKITAELQRFAEPPSLCQYQLKLTGFLTLPCLVNIMFARCDFQLVTKVLRVQGKFQT